MKDLLIKIFSPVLNYFENGNITDEYYRESHRTVLKIMGLLFLILSGVSLYFGLMINQMGALLPTVIFAAMGLICLIIALLGSNKAVANIWRSR